MLRVRILGEFYLHAMCDVILLITTQVVRLFLAICKCVVVVVVVVVVALALAAAAAAAFVI